jgi:hypothetical protein
MKHEKNQFIAIKHLPAPAKCIILLRPSKNAVVLVTHKQGGCLERENNHLC